ncbi:hypothetical protein ACIQ9P_03650 [Kitasatospora sp. NPDC094019]|uniref:hypothetical protein n=1 Tax=Kitasatospora sp. NPDC094019 TaxID=3364091 RepID=UPI0038254DCD
MKIRIDLHVTFDAERWGGEAGSDPGDAARDASWYLSDARDCIPHIGEDGCPAFLYALPGWTTDQDILGTVEIRTLWRVNCPSAEWIAWRENPGPHLTGRSISPGLAREDLARTAIEGIAGMALLADSHAVMTLLRPWHQVYDQQWRTRPGSRAC